ncbi:MAG: glycine--tRNA ligase [Chloroflexi bacterium]|nr:glycine--tRNA ligase [Chloroflexota bacterium]
MEKIVSLCKRRGFVFQSSEIYGGLASVWDYGPLGVEMKRNIRDAWWRANIRQRDDMVGIEAGILMHPQVWVASGHVATFADPLVDCKVCRQRFRADQIPGDRCPNCGGELTAARMFNLMFKTFMGPVEEDASVVYLRPETAQGMFVNFLNVLNSTRKKLPFGIGQVGRSFRNEITPGNFIFRTREFEQMEIEYFVKPGTDEPLHERWIEDRFNWYLDLGMKSDNLRLRPHSVDELAHYAKACTDIEYLFPMGWSELEGIANRADYDLQQHSKHSGKDLTYFDEESSTHFFPYVIEPAGGVDRMLLAFLVDAYDEEPDKEGIRVVLRLHPSLAPVKVAVLPLSRKDPLIAVAKDILGNLRKTWSVQYDDAQSIGKRYRRQDEIGTPLCVTVDFETLNDNAVTIRDRDTMGQARIAISDLVPALSQRLGVC